jgi:hypothetical protein
VDWTYLFDARGPKVTDKNLQQNYLWRSDNPASTLPDEFTPDKIAARTVVDPQTGATALRSPLVDALWAAHRDCLSVVNGIYMLRDNAGHGENSAYLWGNAGTGGVPIYPPMLGKFLGGAPLETMILREISQIAPPPSNLSGSAELASAEVSALAQTLSNGPQIDEGSSTWKRILARCEANAAEQGEFGTGAEAMGIGLRRAKATGVGLARATAGDPPDEAVSLPQAVRRALAFFAGGVTKVATVLHTETIDAHDKVTCQASPTTYASIATQIDRALQLLKTTMYVDADGTKTPFIDLTTFVISSEFGRTTRSLAFPTGSTVTETGTDHNNLCNSALIGGKGIAAGLIVGESDLRDCDDDGLYLDVSGAHREKNPGLNQAMGKPFDFAAQRVRTDLPAAWQESDYICMPSVTNTILDAFGVPSEQQFKLSSGIAPILGVLRTAT